MPRDSRFPDYGPYMGPLNPRDLTPGEALARMREAMRRETIRRAAALATCGDASCTGCPRCTAAHFCRQPHPTPLER